MLTSAHPTLLLWAGCDGYIEAGKSSTLRAITSCQKIMQLKAKAGIPNEGPSSFFNGLNLSNLDLSGLDLSYFCGKDTSFANTT